jgi:23S rRNA A2030 N6-methylase RlmJ
MTHPFCCSHSFPIIIYRQEQSEHNITMNGPPYNYKHEEWVAGHGDVMKHVVLTAAIRELQKIHPEGVMLVDGFCGDGVFDLTQHVNPTAYTKGILRVLQKHEEDPENTPIPVQQFIDLVYESTGCSSAADIDVYPGR